MFFLESQRSDGGETMHLGDDYTIFAESREKIIEISFIQ